MEGELRPGLNGPDAPGEGPLYMFVTTLAAGQSERERRCWFLVDAERPSGILGAVVGFSCTLDSSAGSVCWGGGTGWI